MGEIDYGLRGKVEGGLVAITQRQPNIYDVARMANVSHQTVSRVLNNNSSIRPETKSRVLKAMETLGYRPNQAARALASAKTKMLGILSSDTDFTGPASMVHEMEVAARARGYFVVSCGVDPTNLASVQGGIEHLMNLGVEGLAIVTPHADAVEYVRQQVVAIPVVSLDSMYHMDELAVSVDNFAGAVAATEHLIELGHRNIVHISGPKNWYESSTRAAGYTSTMLNARLTPQIIEGDWEIQTGHRIAMELSIESLGITAIFVANDRMALGVLSAMRKRRVLVPERISVIGFDDLPEAAYYWPPLSTVKQDFRLLGERAMMLLMQELVGKSVKKVDRLIPQLIVRDSTTVAPKL